MLFSSWRSHALIAFAALTLTVNGAGTEAEAQQPTKSPIVLAVQKTRASIVAIRVPKTQQKKDIVGTGVIFQEDGYVITNRHVVGSLKAVYVRLYDGREFVGQVVCTDPNGDLAILKMHAPGMKFKTMPLDPVGQLWQGEEVIAIGHPYGYSYTVSNGIVSALEREITMPTGEVLDGLIQHNASINPGNSGGPLISTQGHLVGLNVALREGANGIAFAINVTTVRSFVAKNLGAKLLAAAESPKAPLVQEVPVTPMLPKGTVLTKQDDDGKVQASKNDQPTPEFPAIKDAAKQEANPEAKKEGNTTATPVTRDETPAPVQTPVNPQRTQGAVPPVSSSVLTVESNNDSAGRILTWIIAALLVVVAGQQFALLRRGTNRPVYIAN